MILEFFESIDWACFVIKSEQVFTFAVLCKSTCVTIQRSLLHSSTRGITNSKSLFSKAVGAVVNQHGFNLGWIGAFTLIGAFYIWRGSVTAMFFTGIVGGLADVGYFVFMDLGGFVNFVPGTIMTLISSAAILLSVWAWTRTRAQSRNG